ncbi:MAG TPA: hypothetical protein DET40_24915 [Lentisphaeria bacterium]|nr:MAG: hypothetical protein A2X45_19040 [Lentisphaerae bacterium GWF2_50_93]HCE46801.1 hypothetical protein [Lentisphaeria bacterium]
MAKSLANFAVGYMLLLDEENPASTSKKFFVESVSRNPEAMFPIAILISEWFKNKEYQQCIDNFLPIAEKHPEAVELNLAVATAYIFLNREAEATGVIARTFKTLKLPLADSRELKNYQNIIGSLSELYGKQGKFEEGEDMFDSVLDDKILADDFKTRRAAAVFFSMRADQGEDGFFAGWTKRRFRKKMDQNLEACERIWYDLIQPKDKKGRLPSTLDLIPMLEVNKRYGLFENSERIVLNTMLSLPENEHLLKVLGTVCADLGQKGLSCRIWKFLTQRNNSEPDYYYELGHSLLLLDNYADSAKAFEWLVLLNPKHKHVALAYYQMGICYFEMNKFDKAILKLEKIPDLPEARYMIAACYRNEMKYKEAVKAMEQAEKTAMEQKRGDYLTKEFYLSFAAACDKAGMFDRTVEILKKELGRNPEDPDTSNFLGYLLADKNKDLDYAEKLIRSAVDAEGDNAAFLDSLAWVLYRKEDFKGARKYMDDSLNCSKGGSPDAVIADHAGDIYYALGDKETALKFWKLAAETWNPDLNPETVRKKISELEGR